MSHPSQRWPPRVTWLHDHLQHKHAIALSFALEPASVTSYSSALQSYITFCQLHSFPIEPSPDMLSFYVVYMCHHIKPKSIKSYLSGICNQLETFYPSIHTTCQSYLITHTLTRCTKLWAVAAKQKHAVSFEELTDVHLSISGTVDHNLLLFLSIASVSFHLMCIGENMWPDCKSLAKSSCGTWFQLPPILLGSFFLDTRLIVCSMVAASSFLPPIQGLMSSPISNLTWPLKTPSSH